MLIINICSRNVINMQHQGTPDQYAPCIKEAHSTFFVVMTESCTLAGQCRAVLSAALMWEIREEPRNQTWRDTTILGRGGMGLWCLLWLWEWRDKSEKMSERVNVWNYIIVQFDATFY